MFRVKVMSYIRAWRASSDYCCHAVHAICGQDADLILLSLALHESNVVIVREHIDVRPKGKGPAPPRAGPAGIDYLRIDRLRQYLLLEFAIPLGQPGALPWGVFDLERIIEDFIFLCCLVGNDFLPHAPSLEIREGGLDMCLILYKHCLPLMGGYVCMDGAVDLKRVEFLAARLALVESSIFRRRQANERNAEQRLMHGQPRQDWVCPCGAQNFARRTEYVSCVHRIRILV